MATLKMGSTTAITESSGTLTPGSFTGGSFTNSTLVTPTVASMENCTFPTGHVIKVTTFNLAKYSVSCESSSGSGHNNFEQIGSLSWDVVLKEANSTILVMGYFTMGGYGSHGYFDLLLDGSTWMDTTYDGLTANHKNQADNKDNISFNHWHNPGTNVAGTTLNYKPHVGQMGNTETIEINCYSSGNTNGDIVFTHK